MAVTYRFDFPPDVLAEREKVFQEIKDLLLLWTVAAADKAAALHLGWMIKHPDNYVALDCGSDISRLRDAIIATEPFSADLWDAETSYAAIG